MSSASIFLSSTDAELPREVPTGLKRYSARKEMDRGGTGVLEAGYDCVTGRTVAIKTLLPKNRTDQRARRRLLREARVTAQLQHPNTVPLYDIGDDPEAGIFYTMKRISGENLFQILKRIALGDVATANAFPLSRRIDIVADACQALAFAHAQGVIHRDVKPANIWIGNFGEVILLDWGAAKVWGQSDHEYAIKSPNQAGRSGWIHQHVLEGKIDAGGRVEETNLDAATATGPPLTGSDQVLGTPLYMSPEQVADLTIDERSDIFAAGICLYEAMAIREPFRGSDLQSTFDNIRMRQPTPPSERSPQFHIPATADAVVARALQKNPSARFQSMRDFIAEMRTLSTGEA